MCEWGTTEKVEVTIPAYLSHTDEERKEQVAIDACIAPIVRALNEGELKQLLHVVVITKALVQLY